MNTFDEREWARSVPKRPNLGRQLAAGVIMRLVAVITLIHWIGVRR